MSGSTQILHDPKARRKIKQVLKFHFKIVITLLSPVHILQLVAQSISQKTPAPRRARSYNQTQVFPITPQKNPTLHPAVATSMKSPSENHVVSHTFAFYVGKFFKFNFCSQPFRTSASPSLPAGSRDTFTLGC